MTTRQPASPVVAFLVATAGIALFSAMDAVLKGLSLAIGVYVALLWRNAAGILFSGALWLRRGPRWPGRTALRLHLLRGIVSTVMAVLFFWGLARVPMGQAIALTHIAPLLALFLAALLLKERIGRRTVFASLVALAGVATILYGQTQSQLGDAALLGALAVMASAVCYSYNIILMRQQAQVAGPLEIAFFQSAIVTLLLALAAPWLGSVPALVHWPAILFAAALATASLLLLGWAYARADASYLAPTEYTAFLWASLLGYLVFGEVVSFWTVVGAVLIVGGCIWAARTPRIAPATVETSL
ncbi:DMT family transporter [Sphingosinithalassobacter sp. CS137]|uniref:DMT family transporter n=1 Tax=Sphingosinithalassobacter sp. CS137 TaxID=2762748 RepID=UPI0021D183A4|nr:DMT family transporter [Sphingosinithalassobacter sp. CS137]